MKTASRETKLHMALLFGTMGILMSACIDDSQRPLNQAQRDLKDSLIAQGMKEVSVQQDSLCTLEMDSLIRIFYDSLLQDRLWEIEKLRSIR